MAREARKSDLTNYNEFSIWKHADSDLWEKQNNVFQGEDTLCMVETMRIAEFDLKEKHYMLNMDKIKKYSKKEPYPTAEDEIMNVVYYQWENDAELNLRFSMNSLIELAQAKMEEEEKATGEAKTKDFYLKKFAETWNKCEANARKKSDNEDEVSIITKKLFNEIIGVEDFVGYYLCLHGDNVLDAWRENTRGLKLSSFGKKIDSILEMFGLIKNDGKDLDISRISSCNCQSMDECEKHCPRYSSCGTIAGANDILVKYEDERYSCETNPFFFTFGSSNTFPYQNGYVKVIGESRDDAVAKFRKIYPDINENTVNCAFIYTQEEWLELLVKYNSLGKCHYSIA